MDRRDNSDPTKSSVYGAEFYVQSPRQYLYSSATGFFIMDLISLGGALFRSLRRWDVTSSLLALFAIVGLAWLWSTGYRTYKAIRKLFDDGDIQELDPNSALARVVHITSSMLHVGLLLAFSIVGLTFLLLLQLFGR